MSAETVPLYKDNDYAIQLQRVSSSSDDEEYAIALERESLSSEHEDLEWARDREELAKLEAMRGASFVHRLGRQIAPAFWATVTYIFSWRRWWNFFRPSFFPGGDNENEQSRGGANGALDGLRGVACLIVAFYHFWGEFYDLDHGYIWDWDKPDGGPLATWLNFPMVKAFHNGPNMVAIFFAISGYVLSHRFIDLTRRGQVDKALGSMPSAIFRRWMRLFLPVGVSFALTSFWVWAGAFRYSRLQHDGYAEAMGHQPGPFPRRGDNAWHQMSIWLNTWRHLFHSFTWERYGPTDIDSDAWTISVEYRSSIVVFLTVIALARVKKLFLRLGFIVLIMAWALQWEQRAWEVVLFLGGTFVAEINVSNTLAREAEESEPEKPTRRFRFSQHLWIPVLLVALYGTSTPSYHLYDDNPGLGWNILRDISLIPASYMFNVYQFMGAILFIALTTNWDPLQNMLNMSVPQYLGRLSYALYLVHGPWLKCIGWATVPRFLNMFNGTFGSLDGDFNASAGLSFLIFMPTTIYFADMFMRLVDLPSVKISRKIWEYCTS